MSKDNGTPQFDFSNLSWSDDKQATKVSLLTRKAQEENDVDGLDAAMHMLEQYMAKVVTHVPGDWLIKDAPTGLDWSNSDSFQYIRADKMVELQRELNKAKQGN